MSKINAYDQVGSYKNYTNSSSNPFNNGSQGYQEKVWTIPEQIHLKLKKAAEFLHDLHLIEETSHNQTHLKKAKVNFGTLHNDLEFMEKSLQNDPYGFNKNDLKINSVWIQDMKNTIRTIQDSATGEFEQKKLSQFQHLLTELGHVIEPKDEFRNRAAATTPTPKVVKTKKAKAKPAAKKAKAKPAAKKVKVKPVAKKAKAKPVAKKAKAKPVAKKAKAKPATKKAKVKVAANKPKAKNTAPKHKKVAAKTAKPKKVGSSRK